MTEADIADLFVLLCSSRLHNLYGLLTRNTGTLSGNLDYNTTFNGDLDGNQIIAVVKKLKKKRMYYEIISISVIDRNVVFRFNLGSFHQNRYKSHLPRRCFHNLRIRVIDILFSAAIQLKEDNDPVISYCKTYIVIDDTADIEILRFVVPKDKIVLSRWIRQELVYRLSKKNVRHISRKIELRNGENKFILVLHHSL